MEFFDKLGKKATEAYKVTADKTGKIAKETKMKFRIGELRTQVNDLYEEIGKKVYEKHVRKEEICIKAELEEQCTKIDVINDEIETLLKECLELKDKKQCPKCFTEIEKDNKFCPKCGEKQPEVEEEPAKKVEIVEEVKIVEEAEVSETENSENSIEEQTQGDNGEEKLNNDEEKPNNNEEKLDNKENKVNNEESTSTEKKKIEETVEIESDVNLNNKTTNQDIKLEKDD